MRILLRIIINIFLIFTLINFTPFNAYPSASESDYVYSVSGGEAMITGYTGSGTKITIPSTLGGYPVTKIDDGAF